MLRTSSWPIAVSLALWAGCYAPHVSSGVPCGARGSCPIGEQCQAGVCTSESDGSPDLDASLGDVALDAATDAPVTDLSCATVDTCLAAPTLGAVSGDTGQRTLHATGSTAAWFRVRVTEDNGDVVAHPMRVAASLTPPAGATFAIDVYVAAVTDTVECTTVVGTHSTSGTVELVRAEWGEVIVANGVDDSRDVSIAIRPTGPCAPGATWTLDVSGNWN